MLNQIFSSTQLNKIVSESLDYQCACPAQVCDAIVDLRELYEYQSNCLKDNETDHKMHESIATGAVISHAALRACLQEVLELEGWDPILLNLPDSLKGKPIR